MTLNCTAVADHINWLVNEENAKEIKDPAIGIPETIPSDNAIVDVPAQTGKLTIRGTPSTNNCNRTLYFVQCSAVHLNEHNIHNPLTINKSELVLVQVQGLLDAVLDLNVNSSSNTIQIGWKPPFTIEGVHIDYYEIDVCKSYFSTQVNSTTLYHTLQQPSSSVANFTISVRPVNMAGVGKEARITTTVNFYTEGIYLYD